MRICKTVTFLMSVCEECNCAFLNFVLFCFNLSFFNFALSICFILIHLVFYYILFCFAWQVKSRFVIMTHYTSRWVERRWGEVSRCPLLLRTCRLVNFWKDFFPSYSDADSDQSRQVCYTLRWVCFSGLSLFQTKARLYKVCWSLRWDIFRFISVADID